MTERSRSSWVSIGELGLLTAIALAVRLPHIGSATPWYDDFYHLLAARGWLVDGTFHIGDGEYTRAALFTRLVAESLGAFGDSIAAGRAPALVAGTVWAVAVFAWTRRVAGRGAAWAAGLLFAIDPGAVNLSQWVRFYTLHGLLVWIAVVCVYQLATERFKWRRAAIIAGLCIVSFGIAYQLQETMLIALVGAGLWAGGMFLPRLRGILRSGRPATPLLAGVVGAAILSVGVWLVVSGTAGAYWQRYHTAPYWAEDEMSSSRWYFWWMGSRYPTLWTLFPIAVPLAVARFTRPAIFALWMFGSAFVGVSFGGPKAERYLYFALPFFFVLWGLALPALFSALRAAVERAGGALGDSPLPRWLRLRASWAFTVVVVLFVASQNPAVRMTWRMVFPGSGERPYREADWTVALQQLRLLVDSADVVVSSYLLKPIYYLGRGDVHLSRSEASEAGFENGRPIEFSIEFRTGRPAISTPESLRRLMECFGSGIVLVERFHLNRAHMVPDETSAFLLANTVEVPLPPESWVRAFRWRHSGPANLLGCPPWRAVRKKGSGT